MAWSAGFLSLVVAVNFHSNNWILFLWLSRGLFLVVVIFHEESFELLFICYLTLWIDGFFAGCLPLSLADFEVFRDRACHCSKV